MRTSDMPSTTHYHIASMNERMEKMLARQAIKTDLPSFSGDSRQWGSFITQYRKSTELCGLSNDENLQRLLKCLRGKAMELVAPMLVISENVPLVIKTLEMTFGRPELIIKTMITDLKSIPSIRESKPETIISFANHVQNLVVTMENLNCSGHLTNPSLLEDLTLKLTPSLQMSWCATLTDRCPTLSDFSCFLKGLSAAACLLPISSYVQDKDTESKWSKKPVLTARSNQKIKSCPRCQRPGHGVDSCDTFSKDDQDERWKFASANKLCFSCLAFGHHSANCMKKQRCEMDGCKKYHHHLLHKADPIFVGHKSLRSAIKEVLLRIIPIKLSGPKAEISTFALLDDGSVVTMIEASLAKTLGLDGRRSPLCIGWTNQIEREDTESEVVSVKISGSYSGAKTFTLFNVRTMNELCLPSQSVNMEQITAKWPYLRDVPFDSMHNAQPMVLIGQDNAPLTLQREILSGKWEEPVASKTLLGWVVHGITTNRGKVNASLVHQTCEPSEDLKLTELVKATFSTESFGVKLTPKLQSKEVIRALNILTTLTKPVAGSKWESALLWKTDDLKLPDSKPVALRRLYYTERKMDKDADFAEAYCLKIDEYVQKGYARKLISTEAAIRNPKTWYIPHFGVQNPNKPGKTRLVFDAAAKSNGISLNDMLLKGPDLLNCLPAVLWRFRQGKIGFTADIREMFHQVCIRKEDQDSQRFLWRGKERKKEPDVYVMQVMTFGATCSPATAIYVKDRNAEVHKAAFPDVYEATKRNFYMDDYLGYHYNEKSAVQQVKDMIEVHAKGGFHLCNWISNSLTVMNSIPPDMRAKDWKDLGIDSNLPSERVLGMWWNPEVDAFTFKLNFHKINPQILDGSQVPTKREVLKIMMSVFDPIGFAAPIVIKARILFQKIWRSGINWDEDISPELYEYWTLWLRQLSTLSFVNVPRCYSSEMKNAWSIELHVFCDASEEAFSCAAYFRINTYKGTDVSFVCGRIRVAPLKPLTIPRLELQAAVMGARLAAKITDEHDVDITKRFFWTDSQTVLQWIRSDARLYKQFVAARIGEILELTEVEEWHWIPTTENVADDATRGTLDVTCGPQTEVPAEFCPLLKRWLHGPEFLTHDASHWPDYEPQISNANDNEMRVNHVFLAYPSQTLNLPLPDPERFNDWVKLIESTAYVRRFIHNCLAKIHEHKVKKTGPLSPEELKEDEVWWWKLVQRPFFPHVQENKELQKLCLMIDDIGVLRVSSRLLLSESLDAGVKEPILLPHDHRFTRLLIHHYHKLANHQGVETVLNNLREKYWILRARSAVKFSFQNCQECKIRKAKPAEPIMGLLPTARVNMQQFAFACVGIDYFGPYLITVSIRRREKRYGLLFTCLTVRAVHIEVTSSLSTDSTLMAISRFIDRRGTPSEFYSDNGTSFRGASRELRTMLQGLDHDRIQRKLAPSGIKWHFNPPSAPHMGGSWERLVRSVKTSLSAVMREQHPREETFTTFLTNIEAVLNSRPLTHVSVDPNDPICLTPNHFLRPQNPLPVIQNNLDQASILRRQWRVAQKLADHFWQRWLKEYLPTLTLRGKWHKSPPDVKEGDIVIICDPNHPRNLWPRGRIVKVYPGPDNHVRVVDVKTSEGVYRRPVRKVAVLDVRMDEED